MSYHSQHQHGADSPANCWIYPRTSFFQMAFKHQSFCRYSWHHSCRNKCLKTDNKWKANPAPYNKQIDLSAMNDNSLNLHVTRKVKGEPNTANTIHMPSVVTLDKNTQFVWLGKIRVQNNNITPKIQREIVKYVIGTHQTLIQSYPDLGQVSTRELEEVD